MKLQTTEDQSPSQIIPVRFHINDWWPGANPKYTCQVAFQEKCSFTVPKVIKGFKGQHMTLKTDNDVLGIRFDDCKMISVPSGFCSFFPNLEILLIYNSDIKKLTKNDFIRCGQLKEIWFNALQVEYLPGNLFDHMPNLEIISFQSCGVKYIDDNILDKLPNLKVVKFNNNIRIDEFYDSVSKNKNLGISLEDLKLKLKKMNPPKDYDVSEYFEGNDEDPEDTDDNFLPDAVLADVKKFFKLETSKDLTITVDGEDFKVHKFILAARSSVLAELIFKNQQSTLELTDMKKEIFQDILKYIYEDKLPAINNNAFDLFSAACRFDLDVLKKHAISKMTTGVTADNALEMLIYGKLYGNESLKKNAFDEIKKMFPGKELSDELAEDTDKVKKIIDAKKAMDEKIKKAQEEFEQLGLFD